ncbi:hypothetical protein ABEB36_013750 [Hypothenemus hampei]|uniref:Uncharacterized protein n=1 Tax=Hypothenemus hampei TaxID=57062 RepID=A0ABD1E564_HYPHA
MINKLSVELKMSSHTTCFVRGCTSTAEAGKSTFFRIRKDFEMARLWLIASHREDLLEKSPETH